MSLKLKAITIRRTESYSTPANTLVGTIDFIDEQGGALTVVLSPSSIIKFGKLCMDEVQARAKAQAAEVPFAFVDAHAELEIQANPLLSNEE